MILVLLLLCGCSGSQENSETYFCLDTVVTFTANCGRDTLSRANEKCRDYENLLSRTVDKSEVSLLNKNGSGKVSDETLKLIKTAVYYGDKTGGKFDITICPVSSLWDFEGTALPDRSEIAEALKNVDYESIKIVGNAVDLNGKQIDLGSVAKGYIADQIVKFLKQNGATKGIVNLGGNIAVFGKEYTVGIKKPFTENETVAKLKIKDMSAVTSGIYERYIEKDGKIYHHILDPKTGYGVENTLAGVTVIGKDGFSCDAMSTSLMLLGKEEGLKLINNTADLEAVFVEKNGKITLSDGLTLKGNVIKKND